MQAKYRAVIGFSLSALFIAMLTVGIKLTRPNAHADSLASSATATPTASPSSSTATCFSAPVPTATFNPSSIDSAAVASIWNVLDDPLYNAAEYRRAGPARVGSCGAASTQNADFDAANPGNPTAQGTNTNGTTGGSCSMEQQRFAAEAIQAGLHDGETAYLNQGEQSLAWTFAHQAPDGGFPCAEVPGNIGGAFHDASFITESTARALLTLAHSDDSNNQAIIADYLPKLQALAEWELRPDIAAAGVAENAKNFHRRWLVAAGLAETAALTDPSLPYACSESSASSSPSPSPSATPCSCPVDGSAATLRNCLLDAASNEITDALTNGEKAESGYPGDYFLENGPGGYGYDLSYNLVGMHFAANFLAVWPTDTPARAQLATAAKQGMVNGLAWSDAHIYDSAVAGSIPDPNHCTGTGTSSDTLAHTFVPGEADMSGSTRVFWCTPDTAPGGEIKAFDYNSAFYAFMEAYLLTGSAMYDNAAYALGNAVVTVNTAGDAKANFFTTAFPTSLCIDAGLPAGRLASPSIQLTNMSTTPPSTSTPVPTVNPTTGYVLVVPSSGFADDAQYSGLLKVPGFLARRVTGLYAVTGPHCQSLDTSGRLIPGDANGNNAIDLSDIDVAIGDYNGTANEYDQTLNVAFNGNSSLPPTLAELVTMIREYRETPNGDS